MSFRVPRKKEHYRVSRKLTTKVCFKSKQSSKDRRSIQHMGEKVNKEWRPWKNQTEMLEMKNSVSSIKSPWKSIAKRSRRSNVRDGRQAEKVSFNKISASNTTSPKS